MHLVLLGTDLLTSWQCSWLFIVDCVWIKPACCY